MEFCRNREIKVVRRVQVIVKLEKKFELENQRVKSEDRLKEPKWKS